MYIMYTCSRLSSTLTICSLLAFTSTTYSSVASTAAVQRERVVLEGAGSTPHTEPIMSSIGTLGAGDWFYHDRLQVEGVVRKQLPNYTVVQLRKRETQPDLMRDLGPRRPIWRRWDVEVMQGPEPQIRPPASGARLTCDQVVEIRASAATQEVLAARYGVSGSTISRIQLRHTWRWMP